MHNKSIIQRLSEWHPRLSFSVCGWIRIQFGFLPHKVWRWLRIYTIWSSLEMVREYQNIPYSPPPHHDSDRPYIKSLKPPNKSLGKVEFLRSFYAFWTGLALPLFSSWYYYSGKFNLLLYSPICFFAQTFVQSNQAIGEKYSANVQLIQRNGVFWMTYEKIVVG